MSLTPTPDFWARFPHDPRSPGNAGLRAGDSERQLVVDELGEAFAQGRLTREELDERSTAAVQAQLLGDLPPLVADLVRSGPAGVATRDLRGQAVQRFEKERREAVWAFLSTSAICWLIWSVVMPGGFPWPAIVTLVTGLNALQVQFRRQDIVASHERRLERRARKELGPGRTES